MVGVVCCWLLTVGAVRCCLLLFVCLAFVCLFVCFGVKCLLLAVLCRLRLLVVVCC